MLLLQFSSGRGIGQAIARVIRGEPGALAGLAITVAVVIGCIVAYRWWLDRA
jgi:hypothetical protein